MGSLKEYTVVIVGFAESPTSLVSIIQPNIRLSYIIGDRQLTKVLIT